MPPTHSTRKRVRRPASFFRAGANRRDVSFSARTLGLREQTFLRQLVQESEFEFETGRIRVVDGAFPELGVPPEFELTVSRPAPLPLTDGEEPPEREPEIETYKAPLVVLTAGESTPQARDDWRNPIRDDGWVLELAEDAD